MISSLIMGLLAMNFAISPILVHSRASKCEILRKFDIRKNFLSQSCNCPLTKKAQVTNSPNYITSIISSENLKTFPFGWK